MHRTSPLIHVRAPHTKPNIFYQAPFFVTCFSTPNHFPTRSGFQGYSLDRPLLKVSYTKASAMVQRGLSISTTRYATSLNWV
eukprot:1160432-Pelagomonas_calceolata.AAC.11